MSNKENKSSKVGLTIGETLFRFRSFTPVPLIIVILIFFRPLNFSKANILFNIAGISFIILGEMIRIVSVGYSFPGTSGRESYLKADSLNTSGIYSVVRNPLYIGNLFIYTGLFFTFSNFLALTFFDTLLIIQYYFIISYEENFLVNEYGKKYAGYSEKVNRVIPRFSNYKPPVNKFNLRKVIFAENDSIFNALFIYLLLLNYKDSVFYKSAFFEKIDNFILPVILIFLYIVVKIIKKSKKF